MGQEEIEKQIDTLRSKRSNLHLLIRECDDKIRELELSAKLLDDPHALIPKSYNTIDEWLKGHPFPNVVNSMRFKNKTIAREVQRCCNTYQLDYHIVKC